MKKIYLTKDKVAFVDDEDYDWLVEYIWCYSISPTNKYGYASTNIITPQFRIKETMHRLIMQPIPKGLEVDHKDRNGLNNQRYNLRLVTRAQNKQNAIKTNNCSSKYKGVHFDKFHNKYKVRIVVNKKEIFLGYYYDEIAAGQRYDLAAKLYFGEFARLNFPKESE